MEIQKSEYLENGKSFLDEIKQGRGGPAILKRCGALLCQPLWLVDKENVRFQMV